MNTENNHSSTPFFLPFNQAESIIREQSRDNYSLDFLNEVIRIGIIICVQKEDILYLSTDDISICINLMNNNPINSIHEYSSMAAGYHESLFARKIILTEGTFLLYDFNYFKQIPAFIRNILYMEKCCNNKKCDTVQYTLSGFTIVSNEKSICSYLENVIYRERLLEISQKSTFANTSSYMGSKKQLLGFIIESMMPHYTDNTLFLDLMCGSGAVSNALTYLGSVYASDAQQFCKLLAMAQGAGFNKKRAVSLLDEIKKYYWENMISLQGLLDSYVQKENNVFHMDHDNIQRVLNEYTTFIESFDLYSSTGYCSEAVQKIINSRKDEKTKKPYCLFTYYYSNVFFGLLQSIQIDCIRYAIDQIQDISERNWALGVLVITTSVIGTTFGGHFAQPVQIKESNVKDIIIKRSKSVWLEFSRRMIEIASESEHSTHEITMVDGPWKKAISFMGSKSDNPWIVYLDAPYKREEYSRYYHVLETLVLYDYPSSENKGRMRSKKKNERFSTEFFTRDTSKIAKTFVEIISAVLKNNAICVWSYSNNGSVSIIDIIETIKTIYDCNIYLYSIPYKHSSQGCKLKSGMAKIPVIEYSIVFSLNTV